MNEYMMEQAELAAYEAGTRFNPETLEYEHVSDGPFDDVNWKPERFVIDNDKKADWAIEKIKAERAEFDRLRKIALDRIAELNQRVKELQERTDRRTGNLEALLVEYFHTVTPAKTTKTQTQYELLSGKLVMKHQQPEFIRDEAALLDWAKANAPDMVQTKESVTWGELKKLTTLDGEKVVLAETGEIVSGVVAIERPDVFEVQV
jgi:tellurite resistance-related uncharacterized protein